MKRAIVAAVAALGSVAALAQSAVITLQARADVSSPDYVLSDVAQVRTQDPDLLVRLRGMKVGKSPRTTEIETLERDQIQRAINRELPRLRYKVRWEGASEVRLTARAQALPGEKLIEAAVRGGFAYYARDFRPFELRPISRPEKMSVPTGRITLESRVVPQAFLAKRLCVMVDVRIDAVDYATVPVWFAVKAVRPALVARSALRPGQALRRADFEVQPMDVTGFPSPLVDQGDELRFMRLRQKVDSKEPLLQSSIEPRPAVARDQVVQVKIVHAAIAVEASGVAARDARIGETVKVRNQANAQWFVATVTGDGEVEVR
jgi:flagella basal body P-ring formation protein FlgA